MNLFELIELDNDYYTADMTDIVQPIISYDSFIDLRRQIENEKTNDNELIDIINNTSSEIRQVFKSNNDFIKSNLKIEDYRLVLLKKISLFIYDWDDTILPSSFVDKNPMITDTIRRTLYKLEKIILNTLKKSLEYGEVYLITNATLQWLLESCKKYYPLLYDWLPNINIVSARDSFRNHTNNTFLWKLYTFHEHLSVYCNYINIMKNIICIGDSPEEHAAIFRISEDCPHVVIKYIKLCRKPDINQLFIQWNIFSSSIDFIYESSDPIELRISNRYPE